MREPNFFIIGAPKCGTTALSEYIRAHPRVFVTTPKEPNHFSRDFPGFQKYKSDEEYFSLYEDATKEHYAVGEASTPYLRSKLAVPEIHQRYPEAKYIVMLRNPVDVVAAWHGHMLRGLTEDVEDFATAWRLSDQRRQGKQVPSTCPEPSWLDYKSIALFGSQVAFVLDQIDRDQVLFIKFDDFAKETRAVYEKVLAFLGIPSDGRTEFPRINERKALRSRRLMGFHLWLVRMRKAVGIGDDSGIRKITQWFANGIRKWNHVEPAGKSICNSVRRDVFEHYAPQCPLLESLTGLDLSDWIAGELRQER